MSESLPITATDQRGTHRKAKTQAAIWSAYGSDPLRSTLAITGYNEQIAAKENRSRPIGRFIL
jgi:hypothetical protein